MALLQLGLEALLKLDDARVRVAFDSELKHVILDLEDRPGDLRAREVTLKLSFKPIVGEDGQLETVSTQLQIGSKMPSRKTQVYAMKPRKVAGGAMLCFNELSLDDPNQETLFDPDDMK